MFPPNNFLKSILFQRNQVQRLVITLTGVPTIYRIAHHKVRLKLLQVHRCSVNTYFHMAWVMKCAALLVNEPNRFKSI